MSRHNDYKSTPSSSAHSSPTHAHVTSSSSSAYSTSSPSSTSTSASTSIPTPTSTSASSRDDLTRSFHNLDITHTHTHTHSHTEERPYYYATSQYAHMPQDVHRSIGVSALTDGPLFRSMGGVSTHEQVDPSSSWHTAASHSKSLSLNQGYSRGQDNHFIQQPTPKGSQQTLEDAIKIHLHGVIPTENPGYVEACYHFKFSSSPIELTITLLKILHQLQVDTAMADEKQYKITCRAYRDGIVLPFIIRIWRPMRQAGANNKTNEYWCEFQRRTGDIVFFSEIYHTCVQAISSGDIESACLPARQVLLGIDDIEASPEELTETLKCLMNMASSNCMDIKTQAILALAEMSSQNDMIRDLILDNGGLETFLKSLMNASEEVQRGATSGLANLATGTRADRVASTFTADSSRLVRLSYQPSASQQLIRECARALHNIGLALGASRCDAAFRSTVKSFTATDPQAKQHIHQLVQTLQIC